MVLYHGTTIADAANILNGIIVDINFTDEKELDFGYGFYMSSAKWYARHAANTRAAGLKAAGEYNEETDRPVILACTVDVESMMRDAGSKCLVFKYKTPEFLRTVFKARYYKAGVDTIHKSLVIAPLADGNVDNLMDWYKDKPSLLRKIICMIGYLLPVFSRQYVVKDQELCRYIKVSLLDQKGESYE